MRRDWPLKQIKRLGSWLEELRTWLACEKNWTSDRNPWHPSSKSGSWWFDDIQWHTSSLVGQLSPAKKFEIVGQEAVKIHLTIILSALANRASKAWRGVLSVSVGQFYQQAKGITPKGPLRMVKTAPGRARGSATTFLEETFAMGLKCLPLQQNNFFLTCWLFTADPSSIQDACQKWT